MTAWASGSLDSVKRQKTYIHRVEILTELLQNVGETHREPLCVPWAEMSRRIRNVDGNRFHVLGEIRNNALTHSTLLSQIPEVQQISS